MAGLGPDGRADRGARHLAGRAAPRRDRARPGPSAARALGRPRSAGGDPGSRARRWLRSSRAVTRSLDLTALVAELRSVVTDPARGRRPAPVRGRAARAARGGAACPVPTRDSGGGRCPLSDDRPLRAPGERVHVSPSRVEAFTPASCAGCSSRGRSGPDSAGQSVGLMVHELAAAVAADPALAEPAALLAELDRRWGSVDLGSPWFTAREQDRAGRMLLAVPALGEGQPARAARGRARRSRSSSTPAPTPCACGAGWTGSSATPAGGRSWSTSRPARASPATRSVVDHPQLGAYQVAVERRGIRGPGRHAPPGRQPRPARQGRRGQGRPGAGSAGLGDAEDPAWAQPARRGGGHRHGRARRSWRWRTSTASVARCAPAAPCTAAAVRWWGSEPGHPVRRGPSAGRGGPVRLIGAVELSRRLGQPHPPTPEQVAGDRARRQPVPSSRGTGPRRARLAPYLDRGRRGLGQDRDHGRARRVAGGQPARPPGAHPRAHLHPQGGR